jgi:hypothetical protein
MSRGSIFVSALLTAAMLAGCGGPSHSPTAQTAAPATSTSPSKVTSSRAPRPAPHVLTRVEAGRAYEAMVKGPNTATFALQKLIIGKTASQIDLAKTKAAAAAWRHRDAGVNRDGEFDVVARRHPVRHDGLDQGAGRASRYV